MNNTSIDNQKIYAIADKFCGSIRYYNDTAGDSVDWSDKLQLNMCYSSKSAADDALNQIESKSYRNMKKAMDLDYLGFRSIISKYPKLAKFRKSIKIICVESDRLPLTNWY